MLYFRSKYNAALRGHEHRTLAHWQEPFPMYLPQFYLYADTICLQGSTVIWVRAGQI